MQAGNDRFYLVVPYVEKDAAKALGARWDKEAKAWFAPPGVEEALAQWAPANQPVHRAPAAIDPREEFTNALREAGLKLNDLAEMDGRIHRVRVEGDSGGHRSGAYLGYLDGHPAGYMNNFKTGYKANWKSQQRAAVLGDVDRARLAAEAAARAQERKHVRNQQYMLTAATIAGHVIDAPPASDTHPYLVRKGVAAHGLWMDNVGTIIMPRNDPQGQRWSDKGNLLVPIRDIAGHLMGAQSINDEGMKQLPRGSRLHGGHHVIGEIDGSRPILIAEGYATAATLYEVTNLPVVVAFSATNLEAVAEAYRAKYPEAVICLAGDNDHSREHELGQNGQPRGNPGRQAAEHAAQVVGGITLLPSFAADNPGSDWNDLAASVGRIEVLRQVQSGLAVGQSRDRETQTLAREADDLSLKQGLRRSA